MGLKGQECLKLLMKKTFNLFGGRDRRIPMLLFCVCTVFTSALAKTTIFDKIGASDGLTWIEAKDDKTEASAYIVYDLGNSDFSILSETFKNSSRIKPTPCKYINTDAEGVRVFEDNNGRIIKIKGNGLTIENELLHVLDPFSPYIFYYKNRDTM